MNGMISRYITVLDRELHYVEWGASYTDVVVTWHGLARTDEISTSLPDIFVANGASSARTQSEGGRVSGVRTPTWNTA
jgi:hypothetical protein